MKNKITYLLVNTTEYTNDNNYVWRGNEHRKSKWCMDKLTRLGVTPSYWVSVEYNGYVFSTDMHINDELKCILYLNGIEVKENYIVSGMYVNE